ncbi:MAG TPA: methionine--tRNA ligase, partial [Candidatus Polarisedimenticolia bacterium]|nr:methionine--tRNA ligase [Candidatus Polarisedimenticolia bacterium]
MPKFYLTTAIDYVNNLPHLGTAYEKIAADAIARYKRLAGFDTHFLMGNDEHSTNVEKAAREKGLDPKTYTDQMAVAFEGVWKRLDISYDDFIRTTEPRHVKGVQALFAAIVANGDVYKGKYEGFYCVSCERFYPEKDLVDGLCPVHKTKPEWLSEENWFFKLSAYGPRLLEHIRKHPEFIVPDSRRNEIVNVIEGGLEDISVSRASGSWGIPLPNDPSHTVYVWFDALINYITGVGYPEPNGNYTKYWPADLHVIGKDITRFHCVIWPAMLMSAGIPLPKMVLGHGWVHFQGERLSKSLGNIINPLDVVERYGADSIRYFLLREVPLSRDGDFSWQLFIDRYNADLANDWGNLFTRTVSMIHRYREGKIAPQGLIEDLDGLIRTALRDYTAAMERYEIDKGIEAAWTIIRRANRLVEEKAPWNLAKDPARAAELDALLATLVVALQHVALLLFPVMPAKAREVWETLRLTPPIDKVRLPEAGSLL